MRIATHCTEADIAAQHIAAARELGMDVVRLPDDEPHDRRRPSWPQQAKLMESYGAHCVYVTDSGGRLTMDGVRDRVRAYRDVLDPDTEIGIHAHHNLSLGVANTRRRGRGRRRPGSTPRWPGMGAGAGNARSRCSSPSPTCMGWKHGCDLFALHGRRRRPRPPAAGPPGAGRPRDADARLRRRLLQLPAPRRDAPPTRYGLDTRDILVELGRRRLVGGQEDMIVDVALDLAQARPDAAGHLA